MNDIKIVAIIPARMNSKRYPGKPLLEIEGLPMIEHVRRRVLICNGFSDVIVATCDNEIQEAVEAFGGKVVMTSNKHIMASDRVAEVAKFLDCSHVINVQGDLPTIDPALITKSLEPLHNSDVDITTLAVEIANDEERTDPNVVKAVLVFPHEGARIGQALYFSRAVVPYSTVGPHYHHVGLYAFRRSALERFVGLPPGWLENLEHLEQLRALEAGMRIDVVLVDTVPLGVDTPADLDRARALLAPGSL